MQSPRFCHAGHSGSQSCCGTEGEADKHDQTWLLRPQVHDACLQEFRHRHAWMGFIDADEFLLVRNATQDLPELLKVTARC